MSSLEDEIFPHSAFLIYGPPGAGKGTVSKFLAAAADVKHISTGDIFRGLSPDSPNGRIFHSYAQKGLLVPDELTVDIWKSYVVGLANTNKFYPKRQKLLLDGIPRTLEQAKLLDAYIKVERIIVLDVHVKEKLFERLIKRAKIEGRADDADLSVLQKRMDVYEEQTKGALSHYSEDIMIHINADQLPLEVKRDVLMELTPLLVSIR